MLVAGLFVVVGVLATLIGSQMPWGEVVTDQVNIPLEFFLDMASIGTIISVLGGALGLMGLTSSVSRRAAGALTAFVGLVVASGAAVLVILIDGADLDLDANYSEFFTPRDVSVGPAGFVVAAGGLALVLGGFLVATARTDDQPPLPVGGGTGATPPGWYDSGRGELRYWTGSRWTQTRPAP